MTTHQDDLNALLNGAVDVATDLLTSGTEFLPFALAMQAEDGEIFHLEPEEDAEAAHEHIVAALRAGLQESADEGRWRAVAVVADVTLEDEEGQPVTSAIHIMLEHRAGEAVDCSVPYAIGDDAVELEDLMAEPGELILFAPKEPAN